MTENYHNAKLSSLKRSANINENITDDELLEAILKPREWDHDSKHYIQYVSHNAASREDVVNLQKILDERLNTRQAKENGICQVRQELHSQCFDELIRQVTIDCPERGILLMRLRDELKMTLVAYQTLYNNSTVFGSIKHDENIQSLISLESHLCDLIEKRNILDEKRQELQNKKDSLEKRLQEKRSLEEIRMSNELKFYKNQGDHLEQFVKSLE